MTMIPYVLYLLLIGLHIVILKDVTAISTVTVNLPALIVLVVALYKDDVVATWFGFLAGLVMAAGGPPSQLGPQALALASLALTAGFVRIRLNLDSLKAKLLLVLGGVAAHNLVILIISRTDGLLYYVATHALAGAIYTTAVAWFFFMIKERRITAARVRTLF